MRCSSQESISSQLLHVRVTFLLKTFFTAYLYLSKQATYATRANVVKQIIRMLRVFVVPGKLFRPSLANALAYHENSQIPNKKVRTQLLS